MSEWLTTGQMVDRLKVGEVAESDTGNKVRKNAMGGIDWENEPEGSNIVLNGSIVRMKWHILPKYVTFEEAKKALDEGNKEVLFHRNGEVVHFHNKPTLRVICSFNNKDLTLQDLINGKWTIEE